MKSAAKPAITAAARANHSAPLPAGEPLGHRLDLRTQATCLDALTHAAQAVADARLHPDRAWGVAHLVKAALAEHRATARAAALAAPIVPEPETGEDDEPTFEERLAQERPTPSRGRAKATA